MPAPSLASNAMHLHPLFTLLLTQQSELGMQVHCAGGQRGGRHRSVVGVGFLRLSNPRLVSMLFSAPSLLQMKFSFRNFYPLVSVLFRWVCNPIFKYSSLRLQIRYHTADKRVIANDEIASAALLRTQYHTADKHGYC